MRVYVNAKRANQKESKQICPMKMLKLNAISETGTIGNEEMRHIFAFSLVLPFRFFFPEASQEDSPI